MAKAYWRCINCEAFVTSEGKPDQHGCSHGRHNWYHYVDCGSEKYVCCNCGYSINAATRPPIRNGCKGSPQQAHKFYKE